MNPAEFENPPADARAELLADTIVAIAKEFNPAANLSAENRPEMLRTVSAVLKAYDAIMPMIVLDVLTIAGMIKNKPDGDSADR